MSASRDNTQKVAFVYSNLYQIYQKGKAAAINAPEGAQVPASAESSAPVVIDKSVKSVVLKTDDLHNAENTASKLGVKISSYNPTELVGKRLARPASLSPVAAKKMELPQQAVSSLKDNLKALNDLHSRLRFMLTELEELVKK
jgi:hypothetical protein